MAKSKSADMPSTVTSGVSDEQERKWRAEDALRTLADAEKVKRDPKLMADVEKARKAKIADLNSIKVETSQQTIKGGKPVDCK